MGRTAVFGYGSLVDPASVARTLGRTPGPPTPTRLRGWRRRWSAARDNLVVEKTFARQPGGELPRWILGLNIEPDEDGDAAPNGALLEVTDEELERLDVRELRYNRVEVTDRIEGEHDFERIFTYKAKPEHFSPQTPDGAVIIATYVRTLEAAFESLGSGEWKLFQQTTGPPPVELIEATLVKDRIPPGNPREW